MPIACEYCGHTLPRDDARFCDHCGMLVPSHPFSPQSLAAPKKSLAPSAEQQEHRKTELREQVAQQPFSQAAPGPKSGELSARARSAQQDMLGAVMGEDDDKPTEGWRTAEEKRGPSAAGNVSKNMPVSWLSPQFHVSVYDHLTNEPAPWPPAPPGTDPGQSASPLSEKSPLAQQAWTVEEDEKSPTEAVHLGLFPAGRPDIDAQPTAHMAAEGRAMDIEAQPTQSMPLLPDKIPDVASLDTTHMPTLQSGSSAPELPPLPPLEGPLAPKDAQPRIPSPGLPSRPGTDPGRDSRALSPLPLQQLSQPSFSGASSQSLVNMPAHQRRRRSPMPAVLISLVLLLLLLAAGSIWLILAKPSFIISNPFSVPDVTRTQTSFSDSGIGFSLLYPNGWTTQIERAKSTAHFSDSSHTTMVDVASNDSAGKSVDQYLQQMVTQLSMTNSTVGDKFSFGGADWKQVQGFVNLQGASYTCTIFATQRGSRVITYIQYAPQSTYADSEQVVFKPMRDSFHLL